MRRKIILAAGTVAVGAGLAWVAWPREVLVLIVLDTVRADALAPWGGAPEHAPWIADLAANSATFRDAFSSSSWTAPSTASVFTGLYPTEHGVTGGFRAQQRAAGVEVVLDDPTIDLRGMPAVATLPERLQGAGWRTFGVASNLNIGPELGFDRGFDRFRSDRSADADRLTGQMWRWLLLAGPGKPIFLYLHLNDAHHPYVARKPWYRRPPTRAQAERARYDSEIHAMDDAIASLFRWLHWWGEPTVVLVSDHGEGFGEHGLAGHIFTLHGEVNRVAMIVHAPGRVRAGVVATPASLVDVLPTILELAGEDFSVGSGHSLVPVANGAAIEARTLYAHRTSPVKGTTLWSATRDGFKLLVEEGATTAAALYDLRADPGETVDVASAHPDMLALLTSELAAFQARTGHVGPSVQVPLDDELREELTELGYIETE